MKMSVGFPAGLLVVVAAVTAAPSPYVDQQDSAIKALTVEEQAALADGQGMGFAKAAELHGYPGPRHVLDLAGPLELTAAQRAATQLLFERMRTEAREAGAALIEAERRLDSLYAHRIATPEAVNAELARIEALRTRLRGIHLNAHLEQAALLSRHQLMMYPRLRGYDTGNSQQHHGH